MCPEVLNPLKLRFTVEFDEKPDREIQVEAHAFDRSGRLLDSAPVRDGQFELTLPSAAASTARIVLLPVTPGAEKPALHLADVEHLHGYQVAWRFDPRQPRSYKLRPIPKLLWRWWLFCRCHVPGRVVRHTLVGGALVDRPVGGARVHSCEVDKIWLILRRLPDYYVFKLRDDLLALLKQPPLPEPPDVAVPLPRPPWPDPGPLIDFGGPPRAAELPRLRPQPEPPGFLLRRGVNWLSPQPEPPDAPNTAVAHPIELTPAMQLAFASKSPSIVREALIQHTYLLLPLLCHFPWLLPWLRCDEVAVVDTDSDGRFEAEIWYRCFGDKPDLYFWVEYFLDGAWQTVYKPNKRCHTWWDYPCGTVVTIHLTDPRVPICDYPADLPGLQVVIAAIGNQVSFHEIVQPAAPVPPATEWVLAADTGMTYSPNTDIAEYLPATLKPLSGTLELRMDMSRSNLIAAGITHYCWSYRRIRNADLSPATDTWHRMTRDVFRHYLVQVPDPSVPGGWRPAYPTDKLGMDPAFPGEYLTRIQPTLTPAGDIEWRPLNEHVDFAWAYFESDSLVEPGTEGSGTPVPTAGTYELKLELFNVSSGAPVLVNWSHPTGPGSAPIHCFVANNPAPFEPPIGMTTALAPEHHLLKNPAGEVVGFHMVVHVNNVPCQAAIDNVVVVTPGHPDGHGGPCGFLRFPHRATSQVVVGFTAHQAQLAADFYFRIDKGSAGPVGPACADWHPEPIFGPGGDVDHGSVRWTWCGAGVNGFARNAAGHFTKSLGVATLLDSHGPCNEAAFAETIWVAHRGTNGYQRADWLDASATPKAFALAPTP